MSRRRNVKRTLPPLEVISFTHSSSAPSKRKIKFTTSTVGGACEIRDSENLDITTDPSQNFLPFSYELDDVNESDDGNDGDDEQEQITVCVSSYARKQEGAAKHWSDIRGKLLQAVIESECIPDKQICMHCNQDSAAFRCLKCGAGIFYCEECVRSVHDHRNIFHVVEEWKVIFHHYSLYLHMLNISKTITPSPLAALHEFELMKCLFLLYMCFLHVYLSMTF